MPSRLLTDLSAVLDATGKGVISTERFTTWTKVTVALQAGASPASLWTVGISSDGKTLAHKVGFGIGGSITSGPFFLAPGEALATVISGGVANDNISGTAFGVQNVDPSTLTADTVYGSTLASGFSAAGAPGVVVTPSFEGVMIVPVGTSVATYALPPGTTAVRASVEQTPGFVQDITITGVQTGTIYLKDDGVNLTGDHTSAVPIAGDYQVTISVTGISGPVMLSIYMLGPAYNYGIGTHTPDLSLPIVANIRPVDLTPRSTPAVGVLATAIFLATPSKKWQLVDVIATLISGGAAETRYVQIWDGATGTTLRRRIPLSVSATIGDKDRVIIPAGFQGTAGLALTVDFDAAPNAANFESLNLAGYLN